jgi:RimJ/RimL family protein N-acetyltransferase
LRDVRLSDVAVYRRMRCDPVMMAELGGPQPPEGIADKVRLDVAAARSDEAWISMILPDAGSPDVVAGSVVLWSHVEGGEEISEIGWMVLPEFQGCGIGKAAVRLLLERARDEHRWGIVHAYPAVTNDPSNGICRALGFTLDGARQLDYNGAVLHCNAWSIDPRNLCRAGRADTIVPVTATFDTVIRAFGNNAGIEVPVEILERLGAGKRPRVLVRVGDYSFASTVGAMNGLALISLSKARRDESGLQAGDTVRVELDVDAEPAVVEVPQELAAALTAAGLSDAFSKLAPSRRKEYARQVADAKTAQTRDRRIAKIVSELS